MIISVDCKPAVLARPFLLDGLLACTGVVEVLLALLDSLCTLGEDDLFLDCELLEFALLLEPLFLALLSLEGDATVALPAGLFGLWLGFGPAFWLVAGLFSSLSSPPPQSDLGFLTTGHPKDFFFGGSVQSDIGCDSDNISGATSPNSDKRFKMIPSNRKE